LPAPRPPAAVDPRHARIAAIRRQAGSFSLLAIILFILAVFVFLSSCADHIGDSDHAGPVGYIISGSLISLALWLYLVAQIIHIRANTEK
jgi:hypothetical protein